MDFKVDYKLEVKQSRTFAKLVTSSCWSLRMQNYRAVSRKYSQLINVDKTKVMASDGIACRILIRNQQLEQVDTFLYRGSLITEDGESTMEFCTRLNRGQAIGASLQKYGKVTAYQFQRRYD